MTTRRDFLALAATGLPLASFAQAVRKPFKLAWFSGGTMADHQVYVDAFRAGMKDLGYVEGRDYVIDYFWRGDTIKPFSWMARDVVGAKPDFILATCEVTAEAARSATQAIPIVLTASSDPVTHGIVQSHARPGGNITGMSLALLELSAKRIDLVKELLPHAERLALLRWKYEQIAPPELRAIEDAARARKLAVSIEDAEDESDFDRVFENARKAKVDLMLDLAGLTWSFPYVGLLGKLELKHRMPVIHYVSDIVDRGGLISYGPSVSQSFSRSARYVDRLAKGARPGDLPIEQPDKIETCVNLKTARALGMTIPQSILFRADRVVGS